MKFNDNHIFYHSLATAKTSESGIEGLHRYTKGCFLNQKTLMVDQISPNPKNMVNVKTPMLTSTNSKSIDLLLINIQRDSNNNVGV